MKARVQKAGAFLAGMVVPNIGAFIAWGLLTALFIPTGWLPNAHFAKLVMPVILYLLPILIGYSGGRLVDGVRGGVVGAAATMGVVTGSEVPMFLGAMVMGPLGGWLIRRFDEAVKDRIPVGFEMLTANFSAGILAMGLMLLAYSFVGSAVEGLTRVMGAAARAVSNAGLLPLIALFIEPGKVLFVNNAINHGVLAPLGIAEAKQFGRSIFFLLEANPGPGLGLLVAYWLFGKGAARQTSPGAIVIHFLGGIHEIYFPFVLMNPLTIVAAVAGGAAADAVFVATHAGLIATPSPGSILSIVAMAPRGGLIPVLLGVAAGAIVSCVVAIPFVRMSPGDGDGKDLERARKETRAWRAEASLGRPPAAIYFACEAGMGSSVMGAAVLRRKLAENRLEIEVRHASVSELPASAEVVIAHRNLIARVRDAAPRARTCPVDDFIHAPAYDELIQELLEAARKR